MKLKVVFLCCFLCLFELCKAQELYVVLDKVGTTKRTLIKLGDEISFKLKGADTLYIDNISAIFDSSFAIGNLRIPYSQVNKVWIGKRSSLVYTSMKLFRIAGELYLGLDVFNRLVNKDSPVLTKSALIVFGSGFAASEILSITKKRWFRMKKGKREIRMLDLRVSN